MRRADNDDDDERDGDEGRSSRDNCPARQQEEQQQQQQQPCPEGQTPDDNGNCPQPNQCASADEEVGIAVRAHVEDPSCDMRARLGQ